MAEIEIDAFLADSVEAANGKIYALGAGWSIITAATFPAQHPRIGLGILIRVPYTMTNQQHKVEVSLQDSDGVILHVAQNPADSSQSISKLVAEFNVGRPPQLTPGDPQIVALAMNLDGLIFEQPGSYSFCIEIDGTELKRLPLRLLSSPQLQPRLT